MATGLNLKKLLGGGGLPRGARLVNDGRVSCPMESDRTVDADRCRSCPHLKARLTDSGEQWITCSAPEPRSTGGTGVRPVEGMSSALRARERG